MFSSIVFNLLILILLIGFISSRPDRLRQLEKIIGLLLIIKAILTFFIFIEEIFFPGLDFSILNPINLAQVSNKYVPARAH